ncbi:MAG: 3'-5' exonuclease [Bacteroidetes bacterium]|jgi:DNA polymerase-3 subunit epsilon|nr:3'-5' exonuclease [Bacteroidota bacterium]
MPALELKRPLVVFDLETTGISISNDRIVEIACVKVLPNGEEITLVQRINPGIPIPAEVTAIHGISDADVADKPSFSEFARELAVFMQGCDFGGFNSNKFDFPMLVEEFLRAGVDFDPENRKFVDAQRIFHTMEPRNLKAAYKFYCDADLENAHSAEADTRATWEILKAQVVRYQQLENNIDFLHKFSGQSNNVDLAGRIVLNEKGQEVFNFGKHRGKLVSQVFKAEPGYYQWMMDNDFSLDTKRHLTRLKLKEKFSA